MVGIEYYAYEGKGSTPVFIIIKRSRKNQNDTEFLCSYYLVDGCIYQSPKIENVLHARLTTCLHYVNEAIDMLKEHVQFDPLKGAYSWDVMGGQINEHGKML